MQTISRATIGAPLQRESAVNGSIPAKSAVERADQAGYQVLS